MVRAVFDANVFISAVLSPQGTPGQLFAGFLTAERSFDLVVSEQILTEVRLAFRYPKVSKRIRPGNDPESWLLDVASLADVVHDTGSSVGACRDPDDDKYIAAALEGRADYVVSGDRDLLDAREHEGIRIVTPREFRRALDV